MIEQGLVMLVQGASAVSAIATMGGGFFRQLPKDFQLPSWTFSVVSDNPEITLMGVGGASAMRLQVDCFGNTADEVIRLAAAIGDVLDGYVGTLPDPDATRVTSCFPSDQMDEFDPDSRTYRRMLEFELNYARL